jgi:hypothetical protein
MTIVCHVSDILSDAKVYKTIVTGLLKMEIYALLLDFGFLPSKNYPCFHSNIRYEIEEEGHGMEPRRDRKISINVEYGYPPA